MPEEVRCLFGRDCAELTSGRDGEWIRVDRVYSLEDAR